MKRCKLPVIVDPAHELSEPCRKSAGLKELDRIHRTLPNRPLPPGDPEVLQDEFGAPILDEITGGFIYDNWKR